MRLGWPLEVLSDMRRFTASVHIRGWEGRQDLLTSPDAWTLTMESHAFALMTHRIPGFCSQSGRQPHSSCRVFVPVHRL